MIELRDGWELSDDPLGDRWVPAEVPGTVAAVLPGEPNLDGRDWWFRTRFTASAGDTLVFEGLATVAEVFLDGDLVARSESMFVPLRVELDRGGERELRICCRALARLLAVRRKPRARWRTALVAEGNLRFHRTMLLGRAPGFAPGPPVVGPFRPVRIEPAGTRPAVRLRARLDGEDGVVGVGAAGEVEIAGPTGNHAFRLDAPGEVRLRSPARWWPNTHGDPARYAVTVDGEPAGHVGFRSLEWPADWEERGLALRINGADVFCRGALWTPRDLARPHAADADLRATLDTVVRGGMNMLRIPGIGCYESDAFYDLCDELGILVWQDFMFANLDYPDADPAFMAEVENEVRVQLGRLSGRPSLAVLCGGSEVAQQVTMLGLDPALARGPLYTELLPRLVEEAEPGVPYIPNSPWGGELPFRPDHGVANYYGVGAYRRPLTDARLAEVVFAGECLAFANVPDEPALEAGGLTGVAPHAPAWKAGIPRDAGAGWDFEDVRDHYLQALYEADAVEQRWSDVPRYLALSRAVSGEVMADALGEWRRAGSRSAGALILWLQDHRPGAGWGLLDHTGAPKAAYHAVRRALAPVAAWITDEGLRGMAIHLANDRPEPFRGTLRVAAYRDLEVTVAEASVDVELPPHGYRSHDVEAILGRFIDAAWAYRFGPPAQDVIVATLSTPAGDLASQAFRFPVGRPRGRQSASALGFEAHLEPATGGAPVLRVASRRLAHIVRVEAPGYTPSDDAFTVEPGAVRSITLTPHDGEPAAEPAAILTAINLEDRVRARVT